MHNFIKMVTYIKIEHLFKNNTITSYKVAINFSLNIKTNQLYHHTRNKEINY